MEKPYQILSHPADLKIKVFGETKEELFKNALKAMGESLVNQEFPAKPEPCPSGRQEPMAEKISVKSKDLNALLVDFLSEVLYQSQINKAVYGGLSFSKFSDTELKAEISGNKIESFSEDIKAVTHHQLEIKKNPQGLLETIIVFDI